MGHTTRQRESMMIDSAVLSRFLLSVVNAEDRSPLVANRLEFAERYEKWFPPKESGDYKTPTTSMIWRGGGWTGAKSRPNALTLSLECT